MHEKPIVGLLTFADPRDEVYESFPKLWDRIVGYQEKAANSLKKCGIEVITGGIVRSKEDASNLTDQLIKQGMECLVINVQTWSYPKFAVFSARKATTAGIPCFVLGSNVLSGFKAITGSLDQIGISYGEAWGEPDDEHVLKKTTSFIRAAAAVMRLKGKTYGVFGGRSLGMYSTMADVSQWQRLFGVDIEHIDQLEIVWEAEKVSGELVDNFMAWLSQNVKEIRFDGKTLTRNKLERQIRSYIATKEITRREDFDFIGIKCQPELSDKYVNQCLTPAFMNDPYDAEGLKEPIVCSCEVDHDGALTMQILKLITGKPVLLLDLLFVDVEEMTFACANCGGMSTWYSQRSIDPAMNLRTVSLCPQIQGKAGGASIHFICKSADDVTLARLYRKKEKYFMLISKGRFVERPQRHLAEKTKRFPWPMAFIKLDVDPQGIIYEIGANHIHVTLGNCVEELIDLCDIIGIESKVYTKCR